VTQPAAKVILDSVSPVGDRLTTMEVVFHRFVLAEFNTHRVLSRNSASSRAIPVEKQLERFQHDPANPLVWASEQPGMQGGAELTGQALIDAKMLWRDIQMSVHYKISEYVASHSKEQRLHKSLLNRWLEPAMWHTAIVTSTEWANMFRQRVSPLAQPEFDAVAKLMQAALEESTPTEVDYGEWHMPYIRPEDVEWANSRDIPSKNALKMISVARCARVSYLTHDGVRDPGKDVEMFTKLVEADPPHASPLEHVATPRLPAGEGGVGCVWAGNFDGWRQLRHEVLGF
jgi:hypothetical protein